MEKTEKEYDKMKTCQYIWITEVTRLKPDGEPLRLQYFLTRRPSLDTSLFLYGICVRKYSGDQCTPEEAVTPPISYSEGFVRQLLQHLIQNAVTPLCLLETLDELLTSMQATG